MPLSFIHAADFHLGADLRRFGKARQRVEQAQFQALEKTLTTAVERQAAFVLICGDLFDSRQPAPSVLSKTASLFRKFRQIPVYILPGTHDFLSERSPLSATRANWEPENVTILNDAGSSPMHLSRFDVYLYFCPNTTNRSTQSAIAGFRRTENAGIHIGLAHGSLAMGAVAANDFPIDPAEIDRSKLDYLALGHWHAPRIEKFGRITTAYSGIPQPVSFSDPEKGSVLYVDCNRESVTEMEPIKTSTIRLKRIASRIYHPQDVKKLFDTVPDPDTILKLNLQFSDNFTEYLEVDRIIENAKSRYISVQEENQRKSQPNSPPPLPGDVNSDLIDAYKAELERLREADSPERAAIYEKALELGTKIIKGDV